MLDNSKINEFVANYFAGKKLKIAKKTAEKYKFGKNMFSFIREKTN